MLIDDITIRVSGGHGGRGAVAFNKNMKSLGPTGARGGNGGNVFFLGVSDLNALNRFRNEKEFSAQNGENGKRQNNDGKTGADIILNVPVGTVVHNLTNGSETEITKIGDKVMMAKGGHGGKGNYHFRSAVNTSPTQFKEGTPGEKFELNLELKMIADVGFIGLPNAGKSSLLNELTKAKSKVANYPFTTLEPNLGAYYELILADIPGLIEGASGGKGLGIKFLRHVERTKILFHFVSAESDSPVKDYRVIRKELKKYSPALIKKFEYVFLTKSDLADPKDLKKKISALKKAPAKVVPISVYDWDSLEKVKGILNKIQKKK
ncbi:MAG: GTPase ObgE [Patescibacteria group bacterium]